MTSGTWFPYSLSSESCASHFVYAAGQEAENERCEDPLPHRSNCSRRATLTHNNSGGTLEKRSVDASLADLDYISLCEESPEGGQAFGFPCSSTTSDLEPGGKTCRDFKNSIKSSCKFGDRASKANR